jgi:subtilisin family serine protease
MPSRFARILVVAAIASSAGAARDVVASTPAGVVGGFALVRFAPGTPAPMELAAHTRAGASVVRTIPGVGYRLVRFSEQLPIDAVLASYRNDPSVVTAEPNVTGRVASEPSDPCFAGACAGAVGQWNLTMTNASRGWDALGGGFLSASSKKATAPVLVAVLDTKVDGSHPDFANPGGSASSSSGGQLDLAGARDWVPSSQQSGWAAYHGTYVAGIVAAATSNGSGVAAIGYRATVLPLSVVDGTGNTDAASLAEAIVYAHSRGARVINLSLVLTQSSQAVRDAIRLASSGSSPSLVVAAAGNNAGSTLVYPGAWPEVLSVAGTGADDAPASCSNYNGNVSVSAPATNVVSLAPGGGATRPPCGTSAAAPQVSALASLLIAQNPARTPAQVRQIIERSADDLGTAGRDDRFGWGRINVERALRAGPSATLARATIPPATGGTSTVTAVASASGGVRAARLWVDTLSSSPIAMSAADGSFGGALETVRASVNVTSSWATGPHPIWVSASDGTTSGPATVGVLVVDRVAPTILGAAASNGVRATAQPVNVTFTLGDDYSPAVHYSVQAFDMTGRSVLADYRLNVPRGATTYTWRPDMSVLPGNYQVKIVAVDQAGKSSATLIGAVVA